MFEPSRCRARFAFSWVGDRFRGKEVESVVLRRCVGVRVKRVGYRVGR